MCETVCECVFKRLTEDNHLDGAIRLLVDSYVQNRFCSLVEEPSDLQERA